MELKNGTPIVVKVETIRKQDGEVSKYTETFNGQYVKWDQIFICAIKKSMINMKMQQ